jgi:hypothetical protein
MGTGTFVGKKVPVPNLTQVKQAARFPYPARWLNYIHIRVLANFYMLIK